MQLWQRVVFKRKKNATVAATRNTVTYTPRAHIAAQGRKPDLLVALCCWHRLSLAPITPHAHYLGSPASGLTLNLINTAKPPHKTLQTVVRKISLWSSKMSSVCWSTAHVCPQRAECPHPSPLAVFLVKTDSWRSVSTTTDTLRPLMRGQVHLYWDASKLREISTALNGSSPNKICCSPVTHLRATKTRLCRGSEYCVVLLLYLIMKHGHRWDWWLKSSIKVFPHHLIYISILRSDITVAYNWG